MDEGHAGLDRRVGLEQEFFLVEESGLPDGLRIVLDACDELEAQISGLRGPPEGASADVS